MFNLGFSYFQINIEFHQIPTVFTLNITIFFRDHVVKIDRKVLGPWPTVPSEKKGKCYHNYFLINILIE